MNEMVVFMMSKLYYIKIHAVAVFSGCVLRYLQTKLLQTRVTYITMSTTNIILTWKWTMEYRFGVLHATSPIRILLIKAGLFKIFLKWKMCNSEPGIRNSELYQTFYLYVQDISVLKLLVYIVYMKVDGTVNSSNKQTILNWNSLIRFLSSLQIIYYFWLELSGIRKESFFIHFQIFQFPAHLILIGQTDQEPMMSQLTLSPQTGRPNSGNGNTPDTLLSGIYILILSPHQGVGIVFYWKW